MKVGWYCVGHFCQQIGFVGTIWSWTFMWIAPVFLEAIATSPSFSSLHISAIAKGFILLGILFCWCTICCSWSTFLARHVYHTIIWCFLGETRGDFGEREKTIVRCVLFSLPSRHFLQWGTSKGYCCYYSSKSMVNKFSFPHWVKWLFSFSGWKNTLASLLSFLLGEDTSTSLRV